MIRFGSIVWLLICLIISGAAGYIAFEDVGKFAEVVDLLATIISILIGVSLAVIAVLVSPFSVSENTIADKDEASRITKLIKSDDETLVSGQLIFFWIYLGALALALVFTWATAGETDYSAWHLKALACVTAAICVFAFVWSARLPLMLQKISRQRRTFG